MKKVIYLLPLVLFLGCICFPQMPRPPIPKPPGHPPMHPPESQNGGWTWIPWDGNYETTPTEYDSDYDYSQDFDWSEIMNILGQTWDETPTGDYAVYNPDYDEWTYHYWDEPYYEPSSGEYVYTTDEYGDTYEGEVW